MEEIIPVDATLIRPWIEAKLSSADVDAQLRKAGFSEENIAAYLREFKKERYANRRFNGFVCAALGAFLGFLSCVLSIINPVPELYNIILFGLTSIAILIVFLGLYLLFE